VARLSSDGTLDTSFNANLGAGTEFGRDATSVVVQSDGKIVIVGQFRSWDGVAMSRAVRLNSDGTVDATFKTNIGTAADGSLRRVRLQSDGKILISGTFSSWNGTTVNSIVRLNTDGTRDTTFTTNTGTAAFNPGIGGSAAIDAIAVRASDGKILLGGAFQFQVWNGTTVGRAVLLNSDGTRDTSFTTNSGTGANNAVYNATFQSDGKAILVGAFQSWNSDSTAKRVVRLS